MSILINPKTQSPMSQLKSKFRQLAQKRERGQEIVDKVENIGQAVMSMDGSALDLDKAEGSVTIDQKGFMAFAEGNKELGLVFKLDALDERGQEPQEYSKSLTFLEDSQSFGDTYSLSGETQTEVVLQDPNGLLTYKNLS